jgi:hypothetical protein
MDHRFPLATDRIQQGSRLLLAARGSTQLDMGLLISPVVSKRFSVGEEPRSFTQQLLQLDLGLAGFRSLHGYLPSIWPLTQSFLSLTGTGSDPGGPR